jgi:hypothetical protein
MEIIQDHQKCAEECVMMALSSKRYSDKALWLILAQSWARLAEQVAFTEGRDDLSRAESALPRFQFTTRFTDRGDGGDRQRASGGLDHP